MRAVRVVWVDSRSLVGNWTFKDNVYVMEPEELQIESVGHFYHEDEHSVTLMLNVGQDQVSSGICIPKQAILTLVELAVTEAL